MEMVREDLEGRSMRERVPEGPSAIQRVEVRAAWVRWPKIQSGPAGGQVSQRQAGVGKRKGHALPMSLPPGVFKTSSTCPPSLHWYNS